ncbi:MFS transporter [Natrialbaceae archaeon A-CW3]
MTTASRRWPYRHTVLTLCTFALLATMVARLAISPLVPAIMVDFGVTNAAVGLALTGMWLAYGLAQYPSGVFADRYGERPVILVAVFGTALGSALIAIAPTFVLFAVAVVVLGSLAGLHFSVATTLLTRTYDDVGTAIGLHTLGGTGGGLIGPILAAWIAVRVGWRPAVAIGALVAVPVFVLFYRYVRPTPPRKPDLEVREQFRLDPLLAVLSRPPVAFSVTVAVIITFVWQGLASFLPTFLIAHHDHSETLAATMFSLFFVVQGGAQVGVGAASDRYGRDAVTVACLVLAVGGLAVLVLGSGLAFVAAGVVLVGLGLSAFAAVMARFMDLFGAEERGAGFGLTQSVTMVLSASGAVVVGFVADLANWPVAISVLAVLLGVALCLLVGNRVLGTGY